MLKQILSLLFILLTLTIQGETVYEILTNDNRSIIGQIVEDVPGDYITIQEESSLDILVLPYSQILIIKAKDKIEDESLLKPVEVIPNDQTLPQITPPKTILPNLDIPDVPQPKVDIPFEESEDIEDDTLKYTLLNIIPGLGSFMQKDYSAGFYTISSILFAVAYNLTYDTLGNDLYFIVNLNGVIAYVSSFLSPLRYNQKKYSIKDKPSL
ncbi:hypothetical protein EW093_11815 [Thiospirochaeta perfilievii]|uniref:Uncharacterized protein n=1 Tax=Thiospirochaeta perfilievii TaxID=252967 RepID=A0A5C1QDE2_9SPIO|nr:hypothetical protein [Thiospirochaeta perfilievii]QEN05368.1 hypothetical protein EW093_11815 [Thiospirochaeta perfilievii]